MAKVNSTVGLSDLAIKRMKAGNTLSDNGENRGLRVSKGKSGLTTFFYRYRSPVVNDWGEKPIKQFKIGAYPQVSLAEARVELQRLKAKRDSGVCPASEAKKQKAEQKAEEKVLKENAKQKAYTVEQMIEDYLADHIEDKKDIDGNVIRKGTRKPKGAAEARRTLYGDAVRVLGRRPAGDVSHKDVVDLILNIVDRGASVQAGNVLRELTAAFDYSIDYKLPDDHVNPCYQAKGVLGRKKVRLTAKRGTRVLNDAELSTLLKWIPGSKYTPTQKNVLLFTLMTGCRTGEVVEAEWRDVDLELGVWHLRENKTDSPRNVQLSTQVLRFLEQLRKTTGEYLFPSQKTGRPIQQKSLTEQAWHMRRDECFVDLEKWTPHDLRRSVRTGLARLGCPNEVAEAVLGHSKQGIQGVYDLHLYESEAKKWLQKWNDHLDLLMEKGV